MFGRIVFFLAVAVTLPTATYSLAVTNPTNSLRECAIQALHGSYAPSRVVSQINSTYEDARLGEKIQYDQFPAVIAYAKEKEEVNELVKCASTYGFKAVPRTGGHHFESYSALNNTLVIDIAHIDYVQVASNRQTATVGAGTRLGPLYLALEAYNTSFVGGICPTVGLGGLVSAGGFSLVMRSQGLSVDYMRSMKVVTASGELIVASASQNSDLFWAMLGGGGGTYGIAVEFTLGLNQLPRSSMVFLQWLNYDTTTPNGTAYQVAKRFLDWAPRQDPAFTSQVNVFGNKVQVLGWYLGKSQTQLQDLVKSSGLLSVAGSAPTNVSIEGDCSTVNSRLFGYTTFTCPKDNEVDAFILNTVQDPFSPLPGVPQFRYNETLADPAIMAAPPWTRFRRKSKSFYVQKDNLLADATLEDVVNRIQSLDPASGVWGEWHAWNITSNRGTQNSFAWRDSAYAHLEFIVYGTNDSVKGQSYNTWMSDLESYLRPKVGQASYTGYMDSEISTNHLTSYFGDNVCQLVAIKKKYDPNNFFTNPLAIPPAVPKGIKC